MIISTKISEAVATIAARPRQLLSGLANQLQGWNNLAKVAFLGIFATSWINYHNPVRATEFLYSELTGNKTIKHGLVEEAKFLYARNHNLRELRDKNLQNFFYDELGVVYSSTNFPGDEEVRWGRLFGSIDRNEKLRKLTYPESIIDPEKYSVGTNVKN